MKDRVREFLPITGRTAVIHHERGPAVCCIYLRLCVERRSLLSMGAAVHHDDHSMLYIAAQVERLSQKCFNLFSVETQETHALNRSNLAVGEKGGVHVGQTLRRTAVLNIEFRLIR